ncbi:MAG: CDP-archaeol synthase [Patescibacteria group bacterium]
MNILTLILSSLYFILPAYIANMCPVIFDKLHFPLGAPIDEKLFGSHKTWRGFYAGYIGALATLFLQSYFYKTVIGAETTTLASPILNYGEINIFLYAMLFGIGALAGDLIKSFFKRKMGIAPGGSWFPFDQLDFVFGALIYLSPFFIPSWQNIVTIIIITPLLHFLANLTAYALKLKKTI